MIKLAELHGDHGTRQRRKRVGRGESSGTGRTAGYGNKGQQQRSGTPKGKSFEGGQTPLTRRLPKRGFSNRPWQTPTAIINLAQLGRFDADAVVDREALVRAGLVGRNVPRVKVLGNGTLESKLTVVADAFSSAARAKIEAAGGVWRIAPRRAGTPAPGGPQTEKGA